MINKKALLISTLTALTISFSAVADKPIYKWKDSQGNIKYTQSKPPRGTEYETIYQRQTGNSKQESENVSSNSDKNDVQDEMIAEQEKAKKKVAQANADIRKKNCTIAKNNLQTLTTSARVFTEVDGERRLLTDQERATQTATAQENVDKYCD